MAGGKGKSQQAPTKKTSKNNGFEGIDKIFRMVYNEDVKDEVRNGKHLGIYKLIRTFFRGESLQTSDCLTITVWGKPSLTW